MKRIVSSLGFALCAFLMAASQVAADSTETTWQCYTNAYGQETCSEQIETNTGDDGKIVIKERVTVTEHEVVDAALTKDQMLVLMAVLVIGLMAVGYKYYRAA